MHGFSVQNVFFSSATCGAFQPKKIHFCDIKKMKKKHCSQLPDFLRTRAADPNTNV
jgi:hypothetical protein